ncbi:phage portal protein [Ruminococcus sp. Marseille-P6503]|uniref:phage portal protein n=1 Tax=Ruminococcus sp. Marseille-P6503 TaxID=2364796 RepID=UPI000F52B2DB|nr:phage portal protein [Ruminococcus sp. Marseille-P6503]
MFTISRGRDITIGLAVNFIRNHHDNAVPRLEKLKSYYDGKHKICGRVKAADLANNRIVINHASYIANIASGYLAGTPASYKFPEGDISPITDILKKADSPTEDSDLALDCSVYGRSFELMYMSDDEKPVPKLAKIDPRSAFVVYDDTVLHKPLFGVTYYPVFNDNGMHEGYMCSLYTADTIAPFRTDTGFTVTEEGEEEAHHFLSVPLNEIYNNQSCQGDFEQVISLIDAYDLLMSDRVNDKEQFVNALLLITGSVLGDDSSEKSETYQAVKDNGILELPSDAKAEYLIRQFDEASVEILRNAIKKDIHTISNVPDMSDDNFGGNVSGVAMAYKLLGFELMTKTKERFFKEGLRYRLKLIANVLSKRNIIIDTDSIEIVMPRTLPQNTAELANTVAALSGLVSQETLLSQLPFVENPAEEIKKLREENQKALEYQRSVFSLRSDGAEDESKER